ncbi:hypothetical protein BG015_006252 [Linnemannia schmuckeri]|uniref:Uncharacterized protein n=1 Tax=Linnemannia schmuckeri TaxID=64567 RepID=A0A9P5S045_9FUNG|nr:hypothetical protein BG015_006252 [Linnemannia schmuckeri]
MKLTFSAFCVAVVMLSIASTAIITITAAPSTNDNFGRVSSTASGTAPSMGRRRQLFLPTRRGFDPSDFVNSQEAARAKEAAAAAAAAADPPSDSVPTPQTIAAEPVPVPPPAQTA